MEANKSKTKVSPKQLSFWSFLVAGGCHVSMCPHVLLCMYGEGALYTVSFGKLVVHSGCPMLTTSSDPEAPSLFTITMELGFQHMNLGEHKCLYLKILHSYFKIKHANSFISISLDDFFLSLSVVITYVIKK